ncbi:MAG: TIGR01244 family sulfur transferase [Litorimonas sp.]
MKELPGDVFVVGQILPAQMQALAEQGVMSFINNRPDMEAPLQPLSDEMALSAQNLAVDYHHIPMSGGLDEGLIATSRTAYANLPRPIVAFCASGTRSTALWCYAHVDSLGVDGVLEAASQAGYQLEQLRTPLTSFLNTLKVDEA